MKPDAASRLERVAYLCRAIADLSQDLDRDDDEFATAMLAIRQCAITAHDAIDSELRRAGNPGIGFMREELAELDAKAKQ